MALWGDPGLVQAEGPHKPSFSPSCEDPSLRRGRAANPHRAAGLPAAARVSAQGCHPGHPLLWKRQPAGWGWG